MARAEVEYPDWGVHDIEDLNAWVDFLKAKDPSMQIGIHGISLGAAMALLYSGSKEGSAMKFYVADSSYASLMELGREKIMRYTGDDRLVLGMDVLNPFFQAALFVHDRKLLRDLDPLVQSAKARSPLLILHGKSDTLIPTVQQKTSSPKPQSQKGALSFPRCWSHDGNGSQRPCLSRTCPKICEKFTVDRQSCGRIREMKSEPSWTAA